MMADTTCLAHTGCGKNYFRRFVKIDKLRFLTRNRKLQSREGQRVNALTYQFLCFRIITVLDILLENSRCLHSQRTVHIHIKIVPAFHKVVMLDFTKKIQDLLRTADRKGRNNHIAAAVEGFFQDFRKLTDIIHAFRGMHAVAIGGFHDHVIRFLRGLRVTKQRLVGITDIAGEYDFLSSPFSRSQSSMLAEPRRCPISVKRKEISSQSS